MNLAIFISGGGSTAEAIITSAKIGILRGKIYPKLVISSNPNAKGIEKAKKLSIPVEIIQRDLFTDQIKFGERILEVCDTYGIDFISQNGWLPLTPKNVIDAYKNNISNQHPGPLDPGREDFGGKGMFGLRVIAATIAYYLLTAIPHPSTEATVHWVTEEFDKGEIIRKEEMKLKLFRESVSPDDIMYDNNVKNQIVALAHHIQEEFLPIEHHNAIISLEQVATNSVKKYIKKSPLIPKEHLAYLEYAKKIAIQLFPEG